MTYTVQRWSKYKLSRGGFEHDKEADKSFPTETEALEYMRKQDWGYGGDTSYDYLLVPLDSTPPNAAGKVEGAERRSKSLKPHKFHRVVIQLPFTPHNTKVINRFMTGIQPQLGKVEGRGCCIKHEIMEIKELLMTQEPEKTE